jgi:hypothetical protein
MPPPAPGERCHPSPAYPTPGSCSAPAPGQTLACAARGTASTAPSGDTYLWTVQASGSCVDGFGLQLPVTLAGTGTSATLGSCSGDQALRSLALDVDMVAALNTDPSSGYEMYLAHEQFSVDTSTYPQVTRVQVVHRAAVVGNGVIDSRIFEICPPGGSDSADFTWTQTV